MNGFSYKYALLLKRLIIEERRLKGELIQLECKEVELSNQFETLKNDEEAFYHAMAHAQLKRAYGTYEIIERKVLENRDVQKEIEQKRELFLEKMVFLRSSLSGLAIERKKWEILRQKEFNIWLKIRAVKEELISG